MNDNSSSNSSTSVSHPGLTAEAISRRAYEIWEKEGRPESRDLHHWLRAEQELLTERGQGGTSASANPARAQNIDTQPLPGTRAAAAAKPAGKRATTPPFSGDKSPVRSSPPGAMRTGGRP